MKQKWKNRSLPRGVYVNHNGYVMVRMFHQGKPLPQKSFGKATPEAVDKAILFTRNHKRALKTGKEVAQDEPEMRWPVPYALKQAIKYLPQWRWFDSSLSVFFGEYYFDDLWFDNVKHYRPWRLGQSKDLDDKPFRIPLPRKPVVDPTVNKELAFLSAAYNLFKELKLKGKIPNVKLPAQSPTWKVKKVDDSHRRRKRIISAEEFSVIMKEASPRMRRRILAALNTCLRRKDIFAFRKDGYDPYRNMLEGLMHKVGNEYRVAANDVMQELYATADGEIIIDDTNHDREFDALRKVCREQHDMSDFIFKDFRRTAAWTVWTERKNVFEVMALLGHKKVTTTQRYLGITNADIEAAGKSLAAKWSYPVETETTETNAEAPKSKIQTETKTVTKSALRKAEKQHINTDNQQFSAVSSVG